MTNNGQIHKVLSLFNKSLEDHLEAINSGGCGFVAVEMHNALKAIGIPSEIVLLNYCFSIDCVEQFIDEHEGDDINDVYLNMFTDLAHDEDLGIDACNGHVGVMVDGKIYDYAGEYKGHAISEHIRPEVMEVFLLNNPSWNFVFRNGNKHIEVRRVLREFFSDVFNTHLTQGLTI